MRGISYEPSKDEFLDFMDWDSLKDVPSEYTSNLFRLHQTGGWVAQAYINDEQMAKVRDKFRPQMAGLTQNISPTPSPRTPNPSAYGGYAIVQHQTSHHRSSGKRDAI